MIACKNNNMCNLLVFADAGIRMLLFNAIIDIIGNWLRVYDAIIPYLCLHAAPCFYPLPLHPSTICRKCFYSCFTGFYCVYQHVYKPTTFVQSPLHTYNWIASNCYCISRSLFQAPCKYRLYGPHKYISRL